MQRIEVTITADGETQVEAIGCAGPGCSQLTAAIERSIGKTTSDQHKPDFAQQQSQAQSQQQGPGVVRA